MPVAPEPPRESEFVTFWNDTLGPKFNRYRDILMNGLSQHGDVALDRLRIEPGTHALDVGCGWGDTARMLARLVGADGRVVGVDCTESFVDIARSDSRDAGLEQLQFVVADVEVHTFESTFDLAFSRFGTMFFGNPVMAMRNIRHALKPGAPFYFVVWRTIADNPWLGMAKQIVLEFLPPPPDDGQSCGPGPFSMADTDLVTQQLRSAGYTDISFERFDSPVTIGKDLQEAVQFQLALGPAGEVFREAGQAAEEQRSVIEDAVRSALAPYLTDSGVVVDSSSWTITARNP